jgi:ATP-dependent RNA helicase DHX8/PRP22
MPPSEQMVAFARAPAGTRKVVFATNIAESSITIDGIKFVIDSGLVKSRLFEPKSNIESLQNVPISKAQCLQRSGRAGRVSAGKAFRLFTEDQLELVVVS